MLQQRVELYTPQLGVDESQAEQVKRILTEQMEEIRAVMAKANGGFAAVRQDVLPIRDATKKKIEPLLTTDTQKAAFMTLEEEEAARRRQRMGEAR